MSTKILQVTLKLRRDNDYNYEKVKDSFIPEKGEVCLVDTGKKGLCAIVGDGVTPYGNLEYTNTIFQKVYIIAGAAYADAEAKTAITPNENKIYIDANNPNTLYYYNGIEFVLIGSGSLPIASSETAGIMKLYTATGSAIDGTMTQKAITEALNSKVGASVDLEDENVIFK